MPIRFDPLGELDRMAQSLGQLLNRSGPVRVDRGEDEICLEIDLPGVKADDIDLTVDVDEVVVRAVRRSGSGSAPSATGSEATGGTPDERRDTELQRAYGIGDPIDLERVSAVYEDGVLTVRLPRAGGSQPRRVPVRSASQTSPPPTPPSPASASPASPSPTPAEQPASGASAGGDPTEPTPPPAGEQVNPLPTS